MSRLKYLYISLILALVVLASLTVLRPMVKGAEYTEVRRDNLLKTANEWVIQFDIKNNEGRDQQYNLQATVNGNVHYESVLVLANRVFTYIYHVPQNGMTSDEVSFAVYRQGENVPIKQVSYRLH